MQVALNSHSAIFTASAIIFCMLSFIEQMRRSRMPDSAIENAMVRRETAVARIRILEGELAAARAELVRVDSFIEQWHEFAGSLIPERSPAGFLPTRGAAGTGRGSRNTKKEEVAAIARQIIAKEGHPLPRAELYKRLVEAGLRIDGADPEMVLSTMLWRMKDQIVRLAKGGYWLADRPYQDEYYHADSAADELFGSVDDAAPATGAEIDED